MLILNKTIDQIINKKFAINLTNFVKINLIGMHIKKKKKCGHVFLRPFLQCPVKCQLRLTGR